jgi:hypothetical protein
MVEDETVCVHCHKEECPEKSDGDQKIPDDLLLTCSVCNSHHHPVCIELTDPVLICKVQNYDWHCSNCKHCQTCNSSDNDDKLMFCDLCDRGYHTYCLNPPLKAPPEGINLDMSLNYRHVALRPLRRMYFVP